MRRRLRWLLPALVAGLSLGLALLDLWVGGEPFDAADFAFDVFERAVLFAAVSAVAWVTVDLRELRGEQAAMREDLARAIALGEAWRAGNSAALDDLAAAIREQFEAWSLTPAEADIAGLLLKGVSLRDIAALRRTAEATIRQQAQSVYRKSGLAGRRELAAYFLESLFETRSAAE
jgi:DNA-binding CsgD family transcriptional regulator